jgi:uncharacterized coiled-coil protein SlyX
MRRGLTIVVVSTLLSAPAPALLAQGQGNGPPGGSPNLQARVDALESLVAAQGAEISTLQAEAAARDVRIGKLQSVVSTQAVRIADLENGTAGLDVRVADLESDNSALAAVLQVTPGGDLVVSGANLYVQSGAGYTQAPVNGKGNLIIGYDESNNDAKTGSHNLVVGPYHAYSSYGGLVAGFNNEVSGRLATVSGGADNRATGYAASVSGGVVNWAVGYYSSVSGGQENIASGNEAAVSGGYRNTASGLLSSISGGRDCVRAAGYAWAAGVSLGSLGVFPVGVTSPIFLCP